MLTGTVVRLRISGTRFSGDRSGPAWQPTQMRCSLGRIQNQFFSARVHRAGAAYQFHAQRPVGRHLHVERAVRLHHRLAEQQSGTGGVLGEDTDRRECRPQSAFSIRAR